MRLPGFFRRETEFELGPEHELEPEILGGDITPRADGTVNYDLLVGDETGIWEANFTVPTERLIDPQVRIDRWYERRGMEPPTRRTAH